MLKLNCAAFLLAGSSLVTSVQALSPPRVVVDVQVDETMSGLWLTQVGNEVVFAESPSRLAFCRGTRGSIRTVDVPMAPSEVSALGWRGDLGGVLITSVWGVGADVLFRSDGTQGGTYRLLTVSGEYDAAYSGFVVVGDQMFFSLHRPLTRDWEFWRTDGTVAGTRWLARSTQNSRIQSVNGLAMWFGLHPDGEGMCLWRSDGTEEGTFAIGTLFRAEEETWFPSAVSGSRLYFADGPTHRTATTWMFDAAHPETGILAVPGFGTGCYFMMSPGLSPGTVLWSSDYPWLTTLVASDGSAQSLQILDVYPCNQFEYAEEAGGLKYMRALGAGESSLWRSDGTPAGTGLVRDINPGGNDAVGRIAPAGSSVFFSANDGVHGRELWTSDGSDVGTRMVFDAYEGRASGMPDNGHSVVAVNNRLYFQARGPVPAGGGSGERLWVINLREADFDNSGDVGVEDVFSFLRSYFLGEDLADTDVDGSITVEDVYAWLGSCFSDVAE